MFMIISNFLSFEKKFNEIIINNINMKKYLKVVNGRVELYNSGAQRILTYYSKGDAVRADWENESEGSVQVQLSNGKMLIINRGCQVIKII